MKIINKNDNTKSYQQFLTFNRDLMEFSRDILIYLTSARYNLQKDNQRQYLLNIIEADKLLDNSLLYQQTETNTILELPSLPNNITNQLKLIKTSLTEIGDVIFRLDNRLNNMSTETKKIVSILTTKIETLREQAVNLNNIIIDFTPQIKQIKQIKDKDSKCSIT
jgi:hypothetical protein